MHSLYKFIRQPNAASSFLDGTVKFTPVAELNDPSELNPALNRDAIQDSLRQLRGRGYSEDEFAYLCRQGELIRILAPDFWGSPPVPKTREEATRRLSSTVYDDTSSLEKQFIELAQAIRSNVGIFCLSKRLNSLPMWAHYADNAKGFVVELVDLSATFTGDQTGVLNELREVEYKSEITDITFDPLSHESLFFSKFSDWRYEQEFRVVLPLSDCTPRPHGDSTLYLYQLPLNAVHRLILGWNMQPDTAEKIKSLVASKESSVQVTHARFSGGKIIVENPDTAA